MFCYNCGTDCKEDRFCSNCGCRVGKPEEREKIYPDPPLGSYKSVNGFLEVRQDGIRKCWTKTKKFGNMAVMERFFPYDNISEVYLHEKSFLRRPFMTIREKGECKPIPELLVDVQADLGTVEILEKDYQDYQRIFKFLKKYIEINRMQ